MERKINHNEHEHEYDDGHHKNDSATTITVASTRAKRQQQHQQQQHPRSYLRYCFLASKTTKPKPTIANHIGKAMSLIFPKLPICSEHRQHTTT